MPNKPYTVPIQLNKASFYKRAAERRSPLKWKVFGALFGGPTVTLLCMAAIFTWYLTTAL